MDLAGGGSSRQVRRVGGRRRKEGRGVRGSGFIGEEASGGVGKGVKEAAARGRAEHGDGGALVLARETERSSGTSGMGWRAAAWQTGPARSVQRGKVFLNKDFPDNKHK